MCKTPSGRVVELPQRASTRLCPQACVDRIRPVKTALTTWFLLFGLLLQSVAWALPAQRAGQAERLAHQVAHALDHGHHPHGLPNEAQGHDADAALHLDADRDASLADASHGPHHTHASDGVQFQGLPVAAALHAPTLPRGTPRAWTPDQPPSADLAGLFRPPQALF